MAMLTYPARNKIPDTFEKLLSLSDKFTFGITLKSSHWQLLRDSNDTVLKVISYLFEQIKSKRHDHDRYHFRAFSNKLKTKIQISLTRNLAVLQSSGY